MFHYLLLFLIGFCCLPVMQTLPQFELNPQFSDSYIPAGMQIIAYLTEMMKYELKPTVGTPGGTTTTTTVRPTPPHKPGLYAPYTPPRPQLRSGWQYDNYLNFFKTINEPLRQVHIDDLKLLGPAPVALHKTLNTFDGTFLNGGENADDEAMRLDDFSEIYEDDVNFHRYILARQKKTPPTRAYVTLLSIYDLFNKESKRLGLNKYNGFSEKLLKDLKATGSGTSAYQLKYVLGKILSNQETNDQSLIGKLKSLLSDLGTDTSYINDALRYIPALSFDY